MKNMAVGKCPSDGSQITKSDANYKAGTPLCYGVNHYAWYGWGGMTSGERVKGPSDAEIKSPASKIFITVGYAGHGLNGIGLTWRREGLNRHQNGANYVYFDGHAHWKRWDDFWPTQPDTFWTVQANIEKYAPEWAAWLP
jgi:prepilin-type processing-associated H-X9-DG protein